MSNTTPSLFFRKGGQPDGDPIVFLHAIGTSGWMWEQVAAELDDFLTIQVDLPGHGQSGSVAWESMAGSAAAVAEVIRRATPDGRAHLVGLSLGSYVIMQLMLDSPEVVDRAVFSGLNILPLPNERMIMVMGYLMAPFLRSDRFIRMNADGLKVPAEQYEGYAASVRQMSRRAYLAASRDAARFRAGPALGEMHTPVLILTGENEHPLIRQSQLELVAALPNATARIAPAVGHGWSGERPDLFAAAVRAWVSGQPLPVGLLKLEEVDR